MSNMEASIYERIGGEETLRRLVDEFYARVEQDPVLRPVFPDDLEPGKEWQFLFLSQYFGGPADYNVMRGHPRLRARHMPYAIDQRAQQAWLDHMLEAIDVVGIQEPMRAEMREYFKRSSEVMINRYIPETAEGSST